MKISRDNHSFIEIGVILCEHLKSLDLRNRKYEFIENLPKDILDNVINTVYAEIEEIE